jgi:hypothetical protein
LISTHGGYHYNFDIKEKIHNEEDQLGEEDWGEVIPVHFEGDRWLSIDGETLDLSKKMGWKIKDALKNLDILKKNKIKQSKIDRMDNLIKKLNKHE